MFFSVYYTSLYEVRVEYGGGLYNLHVEGDRLGVAGKVR